MYPEKMTLGFFILFSCMLGASGITPLVAIGITPLVASGITPLVAIGITPLVASGITPLVASGITPLGTTGITPLVAIGITPLGTTGITSLGASGITPLGTSGITPLGESVRIRLEATVEGRDSLGEGFAALVEHVATWQPPFSDVQSADLQKIMDAPLHFRGALFTIEGVVEQQTNLGSSWAGVDEWFIRNEQGIPFALYVVGDIDIATRSSVSAPARFYKTMLIRSRDKKLRLYPTFVTSANAIHGNASEAKNPMLLLLLPVLAIASVVVFVLGRVAKSKRKGRKIPRIDPDEILDAIGESTSMLPDDPAQALASMYEQVEDDV